jgi:hypothetical protein
MVHIFLFNSCKSAEKIITIEHHFTQQFYKGLLDQIVYFGITNLDGQVVYTIGLYSK